MVEALPSKFDGHYSSESSLADLLKNINNDEVGHMKAIFGGFRSRFSNAALHLSAVQAYSCAVSHPTEFWLCNEDYEPHGSRTSLLFHNLGIGLPYMPCSCAQLMLSALNGLERTREAFDSIVTAAGFRINKVFITRGANASKRSRHTNFAARSNDIS